MSNLRDLQFDDLDAALRDAEMLRDTGYHPLGNWTLGQICRHLVLVQNPSIEGYPAWMSMFAFLRPAMRRWLLPKVMQKNSPRGIRTAPMFVPPAEVDDSAEVDAFRESIERIDAYTGEFAPHPAFGRLPREEILKLHAAHAAHHLRFLVPEPS